METLVRWAGYLAVAGGVILVAIVAVLTYEPTSPAWFAFFAVVALLGSAVLGFEQRTRAVTGQIGRSAAGLSTAGAIGLLIVFGYAAVTGGLGTTGNYDPASDLLTPLWIATAIAWFLGNLGYAVALIRARTLSPIGAWLVLAGALVGLGVSVVLGENVPAGVYLLFGIFGIGWIVVGYGALKPAAATVTQADDPESARA
jgi:hypothetical protein